MATFWSAQPTTGRSKLETFLNFETLTPVVQKHLQKVYSTLLLGVLAAAVGSYLHFAFHLGGTLTSIASFGCAVGLLGVPATTENESKRVGLLLAAALFNGLSLGPMLETVAHIDPSIIVSALAGTVTVFACFSGAALLGKRREFLFLGGLLSSALSLLLWTQFAAFIFGGATRIFAMQLYLGLLVFAGYVLFDTQIMVEKASLGDTDYIRHAYELFVDLIAIFVRIVIILTKNHGERDEEERKRRRKNTSRR